MKTTINNIFKPKSEEEIMSLMDDLSTNEFFIQSVEKGFLPGVKKALKIGANIHVYNDWALRMASYYGYINIVKFLLDSGADVNAMNNCALRWALQNDCKNGHLNVIKLLKKWINES